MIKTFASVLLLALAVGIQAPVIARQQAGARPQPPQTPRLYIFDCGLINVNRAGTERYKVTPEEVGDSGLYFLSDMSRGVTGEVHHVDSGYHVVGMKAVDAPDISTIKD